jgi:hypothetical protein
MRRLLVPLIAGCLLLGAAPAQARYGWPRPNPVDRADGVVDTWMVSGDHVVGRSQIDVSPTPTLAVSMVPGGKRVFAWRVSNVAHAPQIMMKADCQGDAGIDIHFYTPKGERVTGLVTHWGVRQSHIDPGTFRTLYVRAHVHVGYDGANLSCALVGTGYHSSDRVLLKVRS